MEWIGQPQEKNKSSGNLFFYVIILILCFLVFFKNDGCKKIELFKPNDVTRITYVYEKDKGPVPPFIRYILKEINNSYQNIEANEFEKDEILGSTGRTPPEFSKALEASEENGLNLLVFQSEEEIIKLIKVEADNTSSEYEAKLEKEIMETIE